MYIAITKQHMDINYKGSVRDFVNYLEKENEESAPEFQEHFFDQYNDMVSPEKVITEIDGNTTKLAKKDPKFYSIVVSPSARELRHIKNNPEQLRKYVRELMKELNLDSLFQESPAGSFAAAPHEPDPRENPNPFAQDNDDLFDEMFTDNAQVFDEVEPAKQAASAFDPDPGVPSQVANPPRVVMAANQSNATPTEITVLIEDPVKGKQVIVIPRPSPWLIELLTGEAPSSNSDVATALGTHVSTTSARRKAKKPAAKGAANKKASKK